MDNRRNIFQSLLDSYVALRNQTYNTPPSTPAGLGSHELQHHIENIQNEITNFPNICPPTPYYWPTNPNHINYTQRTFNMELNAARIAALSLPQSSLIPYGSVPHSLQPNFFEYAYHAYFSNLPHYSLGEVMAILNGNNPPARRNNPKGAVYPKLNINGTQKNIIKSTFSFIFSEIETLKLKDALAALNAIVAPTISEADTDEFIRKNIWNEIQQARDILFADAPEKLLNLKVRDDDNTEVEKTGVQDYIRELVAEQKLEVCQRHRAAKQIQLLFKAKLARKEEKKEVSMVAEFKR